MDSISKIIVSGRYVGDVSGGVFRKSIKGSRHILRTPPAICLSVDSLRQAKQCGAVQIQITDTESGREYSATIEHFERFSFEVQRGGFELQRGLCLERWSLTESLHINSRAAKRGEVRRKAGNGSRIRNPRGVERVSPRQLLFKGMV